MHFPLSIDTIQLIIVNHVNQQNMRTMFMLASAVIAGGQHVARETFRREGLRLTAGEAADKYLTTYPTVNEYAINAISSWMENYYNEGKICSYIVDI